MGAGVRIAKIDQFLQASVRDGCGVLQEEITNDLLWEGAGPTASLFAWRCFAQPPLSVFSGVRASIRVGNSDQRIDEMKGIDTTELEDQAIQWELITNLETSIGLQWRQAYGCRTEWFARFGYEAQAWFDAGGPVDSESIIGLDGVIFALGLDR